MRDRSLAQQLTMLFGVTFLLAGILGFIPGITTNYDDMKFAGHDSGAQLIGLFQVSILHNIVHGLFGIAGLVMARAWDTARTYLLGSGVIYVVLFLYGIFTSKIPARTSSRSTAGTTRSIWCSPSPCSAPT
jgi:hypothetical protein